MQINSIQCVLVYVCEQGDVTCRGIPGGWIEVVHLRSQLIVLKHTIVSQCRIRSVLFFSFLLSFSPIKEVVVSPFGVGNNGRRFSVRWNQVQISPSTGLMNGAYWRFPAGINQMKISRSFCGAVVSDLAANPLVLLAHFFFIFFRS